MPAHKVFFFDLAEEIEHLLRAPHRERGDDNRAAAVKGLLKHLREFADIVRVFAVQTRPVGGLNDEIVRFVHALRIFQNRLVEIADIAAEHDLLPEAVFFEPQLDGRGPEQMADVREPDRRALGHADHVPVRARPEFRQNAFRVRHRVQSLLLRPSRPARFAVFPLRLILLNVRGVPEHDLAQARRGFRRIHRAAESVLVQKRQQTGVVDVRMRQKHKRDFRRRDGHRGIFEPVAPLLHAAVHQKERAPRFDQRTAARDLMRRTQKRDLHKRLLSLFRIFRKTSGSRSGTLHPGLSLFYFYCMPHAAHRQPEAAHRRYKNIPPETAGCFCA